MKRRKRPKVGEKVISGPERMKRVGACCGVAGFLLACLVVVLNWRESLESWQVKLLAGILVAAIVLILAYGTVWVWVYNLFQKKK